MRGEVLLDRVGGVRRALRPAQQAAVEPQDPSALDRDEAERDGVVRGQREALATGEQLAREAGAHGDLVLAWQRQRQRHQAQLDALGPCRDMRNPRGGEVLGEGLGDAIDDLGVGQREGV